MVDDGFGNSESVRNVEDVRGSSFDDTLKGDHNGNFLVGDDGNDSLNGSSGDDVLIGGAGNDTLVGGADFDVFRFTSDNGLDTIAEYNWSQLDVLDFTFSQLAGKTIAAGDLSDFIVLDDGGADTLVFLDVLGGGAGTQVATVEGLDSASGVVVRFKGSDFAFNTGTGEFEAVT